MSALPVPPLRFTNTLSGSLQPFEPLDAARVRMYVCGPTVYDFAHIGNARPAVVFDVLFRLLRRCYGPNAVVYVRNITDVDDKIIARANETGEPIAAITERTTAAYHADIAALGCLSPTHEPRATAHIADMVAMIESLIAAGHAYAADGHVLFDVASDPSYGCLSRRSLDEMIAGARVEVAPYKRSPQDFVLWKPSDANQPGWDSPWGRGRPGWHIECSAMSARLLGASFDIHGGGQDLIFPHHENEIAQSTCAHGGAPFVRLWLHNGFLMTEGEKMSKSLGNFYTVHDLLAEFPGEAIRLVLLQTHYRQPLDFTKAAIERAKRTLDRFYLAMADAPEDSGGAGGDEDDLIVLDALADDLNTPLALTRLHEMLNELHRDRTPALGARNRRRLKAGGALLGLLQAEPEAWLKAAGAPAAAQAGSGGVNDAAIEAKLAARAAARKAKDFKAADAIRDELAAAGIVIEDKADGTRWRRA
ncbi:MAG: cysteine--tRNA ligase [Rhodospirillales bacterium]|jgi:cysteinyl-tRNA synthetase|nr:cysteine--tRNA ligase [Rhodospirillales bacterium]